MAGALAWSGCEPTPTEVTVVQPAPPGAVVSTAVPVTLDLSNVAGRVVAANNAAIQRSEVAQVRAADPRVRAFARRVLSESQTASSVIQRQLMAYGITPQPEATAFQVEQTAAQTVSMMQSAEGLEVDRIYLESQVANDRWLIAMLDSLIPTVPSGEARDGLMDLRSALNARLTEAQQLESMVLAEHRARMHPVDRTDRPNGTAPMQPMDGTHR